MVNTDKNFDEKKAKEELEKGYEPAKKLLNDQDEMEKFLQRLERKVKLIPIAGNKLSKVPVLASLLRNYYKKQYTEIPMGSLIAVTSALLYFVSPFDFIPDIAPLIGFFDDAAVIAVCWKFVESDINEYEKWREDNGLVQNIET